MKIKNNVDLSILEQYGFKKLDEWKQISNVEVFGDKDNYYFFELNPEEDAEDIVLLSEFNHPCGQIVANSSHIFIDLEPYCTYHCGSIDCPMIFNTLIKLAQDGIIEERN